VLATGAEGEGAVTVRAAAEQESGAITAAACGGVESGAAGALGINVFDNTVTAEIAGRASVVEDQTTHTYDGADVRSVNDAVTVTATNDTQTKSFIGGVGVGASKVGAGEALALNLVLNTTRAAVGGNADVANVSDGKIDAGTEVAVEAAATEDLVSFAIGAAGGGKTGVAGTLAINTIVANTQASIGKDADVNVLSDADKAGQSVRVTASDKTDIVDIAGGGAVAGQTAVGGVLDTNVIWKDVGARIDGTVRADNDVAITADAEQNLTSIAVGVAGGSKGIAGSVGLALVKSTVGAAIGGTADVVSKGNVAVHAEDETDVLMIDGAMGFGSTAAGGSIGVPVFVGKTWAAIEDGAHVTALGNADTIDMLNGDVGLVSPIFGDLVNFDLDSAEDRMSEIVENAIDLKASTLDSIKDTILKKEAGTDAKRGLAVTAYSDQDMVVLSAVGAGSSTSIAGSLATSVVAHVTEATIGSATINETNTGAHEDQEVLVRAVGDTNMVGVAGGIAAGSTAISGAGNVLTMVKTTHAAIGTGAQVRARDDVTVGAVTRERLVSVAINVAGGSTGIGGSGAVDVVVNNTEALIDGEVETDEDITVEAADDTTIVQVAGNLSIGGSAGIGGALGVATIVNQTKAIIGANADTNARGKTTVKADADEGVYGLVIAGAGAGSVGVAGSLRVGVNVSRTQAYILGDVNQDQSFAGAGQSVDVSADNFIRMVGVSGGIGGAGTVGVGAAGDVSIIRNNANAYIGGGANVYAHDDITVNAVSNKDTFTFALAGGGGAVVGLAGAATVVAVRSVIDDDMKGQMSGSDPDTGESGSNWEGADERNGDSQVGGDLGTTDEAQENKGILDAQNDKARVSDDFNATAQASANQTQAFIGSGATVKAGRDISLSSTDSSLVVAGTGSISGAQVSVGGSATVTVIDSSAESFVGSGAKVDAKRDLTIDATADDIVTPFAVAAGGALYASVRGSAAITTLLSDSRAYVGDGAEINTDDDGDDDQSVAIEADSKSVVVSLAGDAGGAIAGVGASGNVVTMAKTTEAFIGAGAEVRAKQDITLDANSRDDLVSVTVSAQGGIAGVGGAAAVNTVVGTTQAYIDGEDDEGNPTIVHADGSVRVQAASDTELDVVPTSFKLGAITVGGVFSINTLAAKTSARIEDGAQVTALGLGEAIDVYTGEVTITEDTETVIESENDEGESETTEVDRSTLTREVEDGHGLFVIAQSNEAVHSVPVGVSVGFVGLQATVGVNVVASTTEAKVGNGTTINADNAGAGADQQVAVRARGDTHLTTDAVTASFAAGGANSGTVATQVLAKTVTASLGGTVDARGGIDVDAASHEAVRTLAVDGSIGTSANAGALGVTVVSNDVLSEVAEDAVVTSDGDLFVEASDDSDIDLIAGQATAALGGVSGAGLTVGVASNRVEARIGGEAETDAKGTTRVAATANQDFDAVTISGTVAGGIVIGGALGVNVVTTDTRAYIGADAQVNQTEAYTTDIQDVEVAATTTTDVDSFSGQFGVGLLGSAGISADVLVVRNTTAAYIGDDADVSAGRDVRVTADADRTINSTAIAGTGGIGVGIAGSIDILAIGAELDDESREELNNDNGDMVAGMDAQTSRDHRGDMEESDKFTVVQTQQTEGNQKDDLVAEKTTGIGGNINPSDDPRPGGTAAYVASGATVTAGHDIDIRAADRTRFHGLAGGGSVGAVSVGGMFAAGHIRRDTRAYTGVGATLEAGNTITIEAKALDNGAPSRIEAIGVSASVVGGDGTIAIADVDNRTTAELGDGTTAEAEGDVSVTATTDTNLVVESVGAAVSVLASAGTASAIAKVGGETAVRTGTGVEIMATDDDEDAEVALTATTDGSTTAEATAASAGIGAGGAGAIASVTDTADPLAEVGLDSFVTAAGGIDVAATDDVENAAIATGVAIAGGAAAGGSIAEAITDKDIVATTGAGAELQGHGIAITAEQGNKEGTLARAEANAGSGGILLGVVGTAANVDATVNVEASTGADTTLIDTEDDDGVGITIAATNAARTRAKAFGVATGIFAAGGHTAITTTDLDTTARLGADATVRTDEAFVIRAISDENILAETIAGAGGAAVAQAGLTTVSHSADVWTGTDDSESLSDIMAESVTVTAFNEGLYDGSLDSTGVALAAADAGLLVVNGNVSVTARLGDHTGIVTHGLDVTADNSVRKDLVDGANFKVLQGGAFAAAAGGSTGILTATSKASVGESASILVTGTPGDQGTASVVALNRPVVDDESKIDSGGLLLAPLASSAQSVGLTTEVEIGASTNLATQAGNVVLAARGDADVHARAFANTYGLADAGQGASFATVNAVDRLFVREGADIVGMGEVFVLAGANAEGAGLIEPYAETRVHNRTAFPFNGVPIAEALATRTSTVEIESAARVASLRHMTVQANDGGLLAHHLGRATDLWKEAAETIAG